MKSSVPPPPASGNQKYIVVALLFLVGIAALVWKMRTPPEPVATIPSVPVPPASSPADPKIDEVPPPPPEEPDAGPAPKVTSNQGPGPCAVKQCSGRTTSELETALAFRAKQAHRCYDTALAQDSTLQGHVQLSVRVASNGQLCSVGVASNDMGTSSVANCVANTFRATGHFPAPKGGCVDAQIPISFVPGGH